MVTHFFAAPNTAADRARRIEQLASEYTSKLVFRRPDYNIQSFDAARRKQQMRDLELKIPEWPKLSPVKWQRSTSAGQR
jgi:hypothetical protein